MTRSKSTQIEMNNLHFTVYNDTQLMSYFIVDSVTSNWRWFWESDSFITIITLSIFGEFDIRQQIEIISTKVTKKTLLRVWRIVDHEDSTSFSTSLKRYQECEDEFYPHFDS